GYRPHEAAHRNFLRQRLVGKQHAHARAASRRFSSFGSRAKRVPGGGRRRPFNRSSTVGRSAMPPSCVHSRTIVHNCARIAINRDADSGQSRSRLIWSRMTASSRSMSRRKVFISLRILFSLLSMRSLLEQDATISTKREHIVKRDLRERG